MIPAARRIEPRCPAKFPHCNHERVIKQAALFQIADQRGCSLVTADNVNELPADRPVAEPARAAA